MNLKTKKLIQLANSLDELGLVAEANRVDFLIKKANPMITPFWLVGLNEAIAKEKCRSMKCINKIYSDLGYEAIPQEHPFREMLEIGFDAFPLTGGTKDIATSIEEIEEGKVPAQTIIFNIISKFGKRAVRLLVAIYKFYDLAKKGISKNWDSFIEAYEDWKSGAKKIIQNPREELRKDWEQSKDDLEDIWKVVSGKKYRMKNILESMKLDGLINDAEEESGVFYWGPDKSIRFDIEKNNIEDLKKAERFKRKIRSIEEDLKRSSYD